MSCEIHLFEGRTTNEDMIKSFKAFAIKQKNAFTAIYPWEIRMNMNTVMILAASNIRQLRNRKVPSMNTDICAWLTAFRNVEANGVEVLYLAELSSKSATQRENPKYKGLARIMFDRLVDYAKENNIPFVYLYPLNDRVAEIYASWGLQKRASDGYYQYYVINPYPFMQVSANIQRRHKQHLEEQLNAGFDEIAYYMTDAHRKKMEQIMRDDPDLYEKIMTEIRIYMETLQNNNSVREAVKEYLGNINPK